MSDTTLIAIWTSLIVLGLAGWIVAAVIGYCWYQGNRRMKKMKDCKVQASYHAFSDQFE